MPALRPLIYNLTRLIHRCPSPSPTGVDRVDLRHARYVLEQAGQRDLLFVFQRQNVLYPVALPPARQLIENIEQRWLHAAKLPPAMRASQWQFVRHWPGMRWQQSQNKLITAPVKQALQHNSQKPVYLHSGHGTIHHLELHQQIQSELQADLVFYLHDLIPIDFPEYTNNPKALQMHQRRMQTMATTGSLILANSEDSRRRFLAYCAAEHLPQPPVHVLLIGVEDQIIQAATQTRQPLPARLHAALQNTPFFITIGTIEPRKNHILLLHLWRQLAAELGEACPKLVILGKRGWKIDNLVHLLEKSPGLRRHVLEVNDASDQDMIALLQHARALLFPSFAEGWGMPLAEALTLGTPAICADIPALRECGREHALYLDPLDGLSWKQAILAHLKQADPTTEPYPPDQWTDHVHTLDQFIRQLDTA